MANALRASEHNTFLKKLLIVLFEKQQPLKAIQLGEHDWDY